MKALLVPLFFLFASVLFSQTALPFPDKSGSIEQSGLFRAPGFDRKPPLSDGERRFSNVFGILPMADGSGTAGTAAAVSSPLSSAPQWVKDLRRAEIVAFGSLPLTIFWTSFAIDMYRYGTHDWDTRYAPWPIKSSGAIDMTTSEMKMMFGIAISSSVLLAVADHIIVRYKRSKKRSVEPVIQRLEKAGTEKSGTEE
jgi:hypothetical protein